MRIVLTIVLVLIFASSAFADVEKIALPSDSGLRLVWWPKVDPPNGWHYDQQASYQFAFKAMAPNGFDFSNAETVLYAQASFKPKLPEAKTLNTFVENDIARFRSSDSGANAAREKSLTTGDGKRFKIVAFAPKSTGNWERVAYGDEGEYYMVFTLSSRTHDGFVKAGPAFEALLASYHASYLPSVTRP